MFSTKIGFRVCLLLVSATAFDGSALLIAQEQESISATAQAKKLYKIVDKNGKIYYSDQPQAGAKEVSVPPMQSIPMKLPKIKLKEVDTEREKQRDPNAGYYDRLGFVNLKDKGVVRNNGGRVTLIAALEPGLSKSHYLQLYIDGKAVGERQKDATFHSNNINYGAHTTYFQVVTANGSLIQKSPTIGFIFLHTARQNARVRDFPINNAYQVTLPKQPKVPSYKAMQKLISGSQKNKG